MAESSASEKNPGEATVTVFPGSPGGIQLLLRAAATLGGAEPEPEPEPVKCPECGGSRVEEDVRITEDVLVCLDCGTCVEKKLHPGILSESDDYSRAPIVQRFATPRPHFDSHRCWLLEKEWVFKETIKRTAQKLKLPPNEIKVCQHQGSILMREHKIGYRWKQEEVAAGIVFVVAQKHCPVTYQEMQSFTQISYKRICKVVKMLKKRTFFRNATGSPPTISERVDKFIDKVKLKVTPAERKEILSVATDVWNLIEDVKVSYVVRKKTVTCSGFSPSLLTDSAILAVAAAHVKRTKITPAMIKKLARGTQTSEASLQLRLGKVKHALLQIGLKLPSLEGDIQSKAINVRSITRYLGTILKFQSLIKMEMESSDSDSEDESPVTELVPPELLDHMRGHVTPQAGEDVSDFDDLDDDELSNYIANAKEVDEKRRFFEQEGIET